jgi:ribonuclease Z
MRKLISRAVAAILLSLATALIFQAQIATALLGRIADTRVGRDKAAGHPDGLRIILCGTGSPLPDPGRAGPCTLVIAGQQRVLIDAGEGSARSLAMIGVPLAGLDAVLLTHFHSDHIDGLGPIMLQRWVGAAEQAPLPIHGPLGVEQIVDGFNTAYAQDNRYRTAHHGAAIAPPGGAGAIARPFAIPGAKPVPIYAKAGLTIAAFAVDHSPVEPAIGCRIDYKGRSIVISGDTAPSPAIAAAAKGADLLIHEALQPRLVARLTGALAAKGQANTAQITRDILDYHTSPEDAAAAAQAAGVRHLGLTHIVPPLPSGLLGRYFDKAFLGGAKARYDGPITVGRDGLMISLAASGTAITTKDLR